MSRLNDTHQTNRSQKKTFLIKEFEEFVNKLSDKEIDKFLDLNISKIKSLLKDDNNMKNSKTDMILRNQIAYARSKAMAIKKLYNGYDFLKSHEVCEILSISRQSLSKKVNAGIIIAFHINKSEKLYPAFQFKENDVIPQIKELLSETEVNPSDENSVNMLLGFLLNKIDFSRIGEPSNIKHNYELIENKSAMKVIVNDFKRIGHM